MSLRKVTPDWPLVLTALALSIFGMLMVYSAGQTEMPSYVSRLWKQQVIWFFISLFGAWAISQASIRMLEWLAWPLYAFSILLLIVTLFAGTGAGTAASTKSWLTVGGVRLGQPAELAKLTVVLMLARVLASNREAPKTLLELWKPALVVGVPWLLIMAQPDLGTGIVFIGILFGMLFWFGIPWPLLILVASPAVSLILAFSTTVWAAWFLLLVALVIWYRPFLGEGVFLVVSNVAMGVLAPLLWERLQPYQQKRLLVFLDPTMDPRQSGYHVMQSKVAIGSGGVFGKGWLQGTQKQLGFLPEQHTDFIFAVVGEELGFLGVMIAIALFMVLFLRVVRVAERARDSFSSLVAFGLLASWFMHVLVNIGMTLSLMPITGIPLPFFSYGGSFLLASWLAIGILVRISNEGRGRNGGLAI
ncbi:MAG: rod shape-determining protein RodA [Gemmatimonadota bacterium]|nr:rod shape-determining protein RodA [Gemmatimonadota bacterium]